MKEIQILIDYHKEQVEEAIASNEPDAIRLHDYLLGAARKIQAQFEEEEIEIIWRATVRDGMVATWSEEAKANLIESLDAAVQMTCEQVATDYDERDIGL